MNELMGIELVKELERNGLKITTGIKKYDYAALTAIKIFTFVYLYQKLLPALNEAKGRMDASHKNDLETFTTATNDFKTHAYKLWTAKKELKARRKVNYGLLKIHEELFRNCLRKIDFIEKTIDAADLFIKRSNMTPGRRNAAAKTSTRMKMLWQE